MFSGNENGYNNSGGNPAEIILLEIFLLEWIKDREQLIFLFVYYHSFNLFLLYI
jgi:hypothetical protein